MKIIKIINKKKINKAFNPYNAYVDVGRKPQIISEDIKSMRADDIKHAALVVATRVLIRKAYKALADDSNL